MWADASRQTALAGNRRFWELHASARRAQVADAVIPLPARFEWTSQPGVGPASELFGALPGLQLLELGCGTGDNLAHLVSQGARGIGVDSCAQQLLRARERWGRLRPAPAFVHADAASYLADSSSLVDRTYSVFGALSFTDPAPLLPAIHARLRRGGLLLVSANTPSAGAREGPSRTLRTVLGQHMAVTEYRYQAHTWTGLLADAGFAFGHCLQDRARPAPTLIMVARRP